MTPHPPSAAASSQLGTYYWGISFAAGRRKPHRNRLMRWQIRQYLFVCRRSVCDTLLLRIDAGHGVRDLASRGDCLGRAQHRRKHSRRMGVPHILMGTGLSPYYHQQRWTLRHSPPGGRQHRQARQHQLSSTAALCQRSTSWRNGICEATLSAQGMRRDNEDPLRMMPVTTLAGTISRLPRTKRRPPPHQPSIWSRCAALTTVAEMAQKPTLIKR